MIYISDCGAVVVSTDLIYKDRGRRDCIRRIPDQIEGGRNREHWGPLPCHRKHGANRTGLRQRRQARGGEGQWCRRRPVALRRQAHLLGYESWRARGYVSVGAVTLKEKSTKEIADIVELSPRTVEALRDKLKVKTSAKTTAGLILYAVKPKIIQEL